MNHFKEYNGTNFVGIVESAYRFPTEPLSLKYGTTLMDHPILTSEQEMDSYEKRNFGCLTLTHAFETVEQMGRYIASQYGDTFRENITYKPLMTDFRRDRFPSRQYELSIIEKAKFEEAVLDSLRSRKEIESSR